MILRKPYAFLIKHFMLIHIILSGIMIYITMRFSNALTFIKEYISNTAALSIADTYINLGMYVALFLVLGISFAIFWLMKYKNKPKLLYIINMLFYLIMLILTIILGSTFGNINNVIIDSKTIRLLRDTVNISILIQYGFIAVMIIRTLGFDIKKFNFKSDIQEIAVDNGDDEEFELNIGLDTNSIFRTIRRHLTELKYYYVDNKQAILVILAVIVFIGIIKIAPNYIGGNKTYSENQMMQTYNFQMKITNSYMTKLKYDGTDVSIGDKTYVIIKFDILGYVKKRKIDMNRTFLKVGKEKYSPTLKQYNYFTDIGYGYQKQDLSVENTKSYLLVFLVDDKVIKKSKTFIYTDEDIKDKKIKIKPIDLDVKNEINTAKVGDQLNYKNTIIGDGFFRIDSVEYNDHYNYTYANYNKRLIKLELESKFEDYNLYEFINKFVTLKYTKDKKDYSVAFTNKTDRNATTTAYLEVSKEIEQEKSLYLEIRIRNNVYKYYINEGEK